MSSKKSAPLPPLTRAALEKAGWDEADFVLVSGDAYVDHPSFGPAIIARVLMEQGYRVAVLAQPDWHSAEEFRRFGRPRLAYLVTSGNIDSMVDHYTVAKRRRSEDAYTPGGRAGARPDRATIVYSNRCREAYPDVPLIIGGIEASLRRFAHYDYWDNHVRHSILYDACADLLVYGMGERAIRQIATALAEGRPFHTLTEIRGTCFRQTNFTDPQALLLPSFSEVAADKQLYSKAFLTELQNQDAISGKRLIQAHEKGVLVANPPAYPLSAEELDAVYELPYTRLPHTDYTEPIPALDEVEFSLTSTRGCFGGCNFCALTCHQGRFIQARSHDSLLREAARMTESPHFRGYIHDVGGPTANFRRPACDKQLTKGVCPDRSCIGFKPCPNLKADESDYTELLKKLRQLPKVKKVFVRSGIRYDYLLYDKDDSFLKELAAHHVSGQLKIAPEHVSDEVLKCMNKPPHALYERFLQKYEAVNRRLGLKQYVVPYLMSSHPGCTLNDAIELALYLKSRRHHPEQVQDFYPTPFTVSTCMYYTGFDPRTGEAVYVPRSETEKAMQRALMQWFLPRNFPLVRKALRLADREDLIGYDPSCLVPPERKPAQQRPQAQNRDRGSASPRTKKRR